MRKSLVGGFVCLAILGGLFAFGMGRFFSVVKIDPPWVHLPETSTGLSGIFRDETGIMMLGAWACPTPRCPTDARLLIGLDKSRSTPAPGSDIEKRMRTMVWKPAFGISPTQTVIASQTHGNVVIQHHAGIRFADVIVRTRSTPAGVAYYILQTREDNRVQAERMLDRLMPNKS